MAPRIFSVLLFVFAIAAAPMYSDPFEGTDTTVEPGGTLNIVYSGPDHTITIRDRGAGLWEVDVSGGQATWEVPEEAQGFLILEDSHGGDWATNIIET